MAEAMFVLVLPLAACRPAPLDVIRLPPSDGGPGDVSATDGSPNDGSPNDGGPRDVLTGDVRDGATSSPGCSSARLPTGDTDRTILVGGTSRSYSLHVPAAYDGKRPVPLVLDFHALGGSPALERSVSPYLALTDPEGVITAFPAGLSGTNSPAGWNVGPCCVANVDDVAFSRAVVADIGAAACVDTTRVYAVGTSMGGGLAYYLGCHAADVFAAIAPAAFDLLEENAVDCRPSRPLSVISFRGTADKLVPYAGGDSAVIPGMPVTFLGAQGTFQKWGQLDGCQEPPSTPDSRGCSSYAGCQAGVDVVLCSKSGGGQEVGNASIAWPLLKAHSL